MPPYVTEAYRLAMLVIVAATGWQYWRFRQVEGKRQQWRRRLQAVIDDASPVRDGLTLHDILMIYDEEEWADLHFELERLPAGRRSLARALAIIDAKGYSRTQRRLSPANAPAGHG